MTPREIHDFIYKQVLEQKLCIVEMADDITTVTAGTLCRYLNRNGGYSGGKYEDNIKIHTLVGILDYLGFELVIRERS